MLADSSGRFIPSSIQFEFLDILCRPLHNLTFNYFRVTNG